MRFPLPKDTATALTKQTLSRCRNLGLWLDKFRPINSDRDSAGEAWEDPSEQWKLTDAAKRREGFGTCLREPVPDLLAASHRRRAAQFEALRAAGNAVIEFDAETDYRVVIGFGAEHVLETNLCLHRMYGFPIIPGSAIKGVARARAFWSVAERLAVPPASPEEWQRRQDAKPKQDTPLQVLDQLLGEGAPQKQSVLWDRLIQDSLTAATSAVPSLDRQTCAALAVEFQQAFGTTVRRGGVTFFDAYPTATKLGLDLDVLNPHFGKYYRGESPPADYLDPVPTYFLTVAKGVAFHFVLASQNDAVAGAAGRWLTEALTDLGLGGKTCAGYGFMQVRP